MEPPSFVDSCASTRRRNALIPLFLSLVLVLLMAPTLAACSKDDDDVPPDDPATRSQEVEPTVPIGINMTINGEWDDPIDVRFIKRR